MKKNYVDDKTGNIKCTWTSIKQDIEDQYGKGYRHVELSQNK